MKIKIDSRQVMEALNNLSEDDKKKLIQKAEMTVAEKIGELASDKVPVQKGILKSSWTVQNQGGKTQAGYNTEYAAYQHQWHRKDGSRPIAKSSGERYFLAKAISQNLEKLKTLYLKIIKNGSFFTGK